MQILEKIKKDTKDIDDLVIRKIDVLGNEINIVYVEPLIKSSYISEYIIENIKEIFKEIVKIDKLEQIVNNTKDLKIIQRKNKERKVEDIIENLEKNICACKVKKLDIEKDDVYYYLFSSFTLVIYKEYILAIETRGNINRSVTETLTEGSVKGSKDGFNESYETNIALIRKRLKTEKLKLKEKKVGDRSKTKLAIMYIEDIVEKELVEKIEKKIDSIKIDGVLNNNYIIENLDDKKENSFPTIIDTERPDWASILLLEGRIVIVVENSPFVLIMPAFLEDFINNTSDYFQKSPNVFFTRLIRYIAVFISVLVPALYVSLITFKHESIPTDLLLSFSAQRDGVPFPAVMEAFFMIFAFEILREGDYRSKNIGGSTLSIVGALILGDAAVSAGIVSSIMIIVIAISALSGMVVTDVNLVNSLRNWRMFFLIFGSVGGLLGVTMALLLFIIKLCDMESFEKPYTYPLAPLNMTKVENDFINRKKINEMRNRYKILTNNLKSKG